MLPGIMLPNVHCFSRALRLNTKEISILVSEAGEKMEENTPNPNSVLEIPI